MLSHTFEIRSHAKNGWLAQIFSRAKKKKLHFSWTVEAKDDFPCTITFRQMSTVLDFLNYTLKVEIVVFTLFIRGLISGQKFLHFWSARFIIAYKMKKMSSRRGDLLFTQLLEQSGLGGTEVTRFTKVNRIHKVAVGQFFFFRVLLFKS